MVNDGHVETKVDKDALVAWLQGKIDEMPDRASTMNSDILDNMKAEATSEAPVKWGDLQNSHVVEMISPLEGIMYPTAPHAPYVILGTEPHLITSKYFDGYLFWEGAEHPVRSVMHPGTAPNDYIGRVLDKSDSIIQTPIMEFTNWMVE